MSIETLIKSYETALNANDIEKILALYGSDPIFMPQHAPALVGRDAVRAGYRQVFDTIKLNVAFDIHETQEAGDWAWARTSSAGRTKFLAAGIEVTEGNNELFVFRRERGSWRIHRIPVRDQPTARLSYAPGIVHAKGATMMTDTRIVLITGATGKLLHDLAESS